MVDGSDVTGSRDPSGDDDDRGSWLSLLVPTLTFVVGLALGGGLVYATSGGDASDDPVTSAPSASPTSGASGGDTTVTVPAECEAAGAGVAEAYALLRQAVDQVRDFDANALVGTLDELQTVDEETRPLVEACSRVSVSTTPTGSPDADPGADG